MGQSIVLGKVNSKTRQPKEEEVAEVKVEVVDHVQALLCMLGVVAAVVRA